MNDKELQALLASLRIPPRDEETEEQTLQRALQALNSATPAERAPVSWTWRDWLWPSPVAWGAMSAVWLMVLVQHAADDSPASALANESQRTPIPHPSPLFARHDLQELLRQFNAEQTGR